MIGTREAAELFFKKIEMGGTGSTEEKPPPEVVIKGAHLINPPNPFKYQRRRFSSAWMKM